jgi:hypothetical protein
MFAFLVKGYAVLVHCDGWRLEEQPETMAPFPVAISIGQFSAKHNFLIA